MLDHLIICFDFSRKSLYYSCQGVDNYWAGC